ncbi:hypothetical protein EUTSA_v10023070mg [Eutrema salsugineum]|uniref:AB hydrolase-1 domain-containing protein n=1 Tax=Eutrema salsugineum TaxID=72664 RepID=V4LJG9_EUTSA|nr:hypothetical protein EUTSA_v10023070mg [Eutrema salsugineum]
MLILLGIVGLISYYVYKSIIPPPSIPLPENVSKKSPRVKLNDDKAENKIIVVHGYGNSKDVDLYTTQEMIDEFKIYFLFFDRAGYGESDPNPSRTLKTDTDDIEELADKLQIGPKFHVLGMSLGAYPVNGCLKYIPHRLCGASLVVPSVNFWWRRMPRKLLNAAIQKLPFEFRLTLRVAHYFPWLLYWWMTQKWFPNSRDPKKTLRNESALRQGEYVSTQRDIIAGYGNWEIDPTELSNPFSDSNKGSVHIWCALADKQILREVLLYICDKLPWIKLHELPEAGHWIIHEKRHFEAIIKAACTE